MSTPLRLALIGSGGISSAHAVGILAHSDKIKCVALCDVSEDNLNARAKQLGESEVSPIAKYRDWKRMFAEIGDSIDAVDICLPHHLHAAAIFDAVAAGKAVLCEKPMCISLTEADAIVDAVAQAGVLYMSAHNQLFTPALQEMKRRLDAGVIGRVRWIRSQDCFIAPTQAFAGKWRSDIRHQGGGELIDTGYHPSYRLMFLAGAEAVAIRGTMGRFEQFIQGEDTASVQVRFSNGVMGEIFTSWAMTKPSGTHDLHVIGDKGEIFGTGNRIWQIMRGEKEADETVLPVVDTFTAQIGCFADCILNKTAPPHGPIEGRDVLRIILKASENADGWQETAPLKIG
ncbi:MAG TPA: Gfo/Idh/MocA family oxidoreductase [Candidatus Methylacidiphilales bacterium]|nr:Gfo/Idh/MocA family oxidoreductase [Candidatus Methylacidiphilales bacterium]